MEIDRKSRFRYWRSQFYETSCQSIKQWPVLSLLSDDFIARIRMVYVVGHTLGEIALIISEDDQVFVVGQCSFASNKSSGFQPYLVSSLSGLNIQSFHYVNNALIIAIAQNGSVYYSHDKSGSFLELPDINCKLPYVASTRSHFCTLDDRKDLITIDIESLMQTSRGSHRARDTWLSGHSLLQLEGTNYCCNMLREDGTVHCTCQNPFLPLFENKIVRIACGYNFTIGIDNLGVVHEYQHDENTLKKNLTSHIGKVVDVAAIRDSHIRVAVTDNLQFFIWGTCGGIEIDKPHPCNYKSIHDVLLAYAYPRIMNRPYFLRNSINTEPTYISSSISNAFDNSVTSDFIIFVENTPIHVHKTILGSRSSFFERMFANEWKENQKHEFEDVTFSYDTYRTYLQYLYTGKLALSECGTTEDINKLEQLCAIADLYMEDSLKWQCTKFMSTRISSENVLQVYKWATRYHFEELLEGAILFIVENFNEIVGSAEFQNLEKCHILSILNAAGEHKVFKT